MIDIAQLKTLQHNGPITVAIGSSATSKVWSKASMQWSDFLERLMIPAVSKETREKYESSPKSVKTRIKDVGGYVGGTLDSEQRGKNNVLSRQLITLDLDDVTDVHLSWVMFSGFFECAATIHTTYSHTPEKPRARLIIPLKFDVSPSEYVRISKYIGNFLGVEQLDDTTHEPNRLMFWPCVPVDCQHEYIMEYADAPWLDPTSILGDVVREELKVSAAESDPRDIPGVVGVFNKAYFLHVALQEFLSDVYAPVEDNRYKLIASDSTAGLVIYDGGLWCFSHHAKDPVQGKLTHAFDLVCAHKFGGNKDEMVKWIEANDICALDSFVPDLVLDRKGHPMNTTRNMRLILNKDPELSGAVYADMLAGKMMVAGDFPWIGLMDRTTPTWSDLDDAGLREFMETKYNFTDRQKIYDAVALSAQDNRRHPIREYLKRLQWDGVPRAETLLIDFLNAQDSPYTRAVTRKALLGATARVMNPGVKHDHVLVLVGPQGCRKSTTIAKLGGNWYTDSLYTMNGKEASELIQGYWLVELSEMAATRKSDVEMIKQFLTKTSDNFRAAYDRRAMEHPRQCAFFGTTNDDEFLVDATGNRRFWPVAVSKVSELKYAELDQYYVDQIWAEMLIAYNLGEEKLYLSAEEESTAQDKQAEFTKINPLVGSITEWLGSFVPDDWNERDAQKRQEFYNCPDMFEAFSVRDRVCAMEVWVECLKGNSKELTLAKSTEIRNVINKIPGWVKTSTVRCGGGFGVQRGFKRG